MRYGAADRLRFFVEAVRHSRHSPLLMQAGARSVSQPPTPTGKALAGDGGKLPQGRMVHTSFWNAVYSGIQRPASCQAR